MGRICLPKIVGCVHQFGAGRSMALPPAGTVLAQLFVKLFFSIGPAGPIAWIDQAAVVSASVRLCASRAAFASSLVA